MEINPLSVILFANILSCPVGCLFILLMTSFAVQKLLNLIRSHLFISAFVSITLGDRSKKILLWFISKSVLPMFFSKSFYSFGLIFRSFNLFWVYFCVWCLKKNYFILLHVAVQFSQHHLLKRLCFLHCIFLFPLS